MDADEMLRVQYTVLILRGVLSACRPRGRTALGGGEVDLAGSVDDFRREVLSLEANRLAEGVFNGRVVALNEVAVDKLDRQGGFACQASVSVPVSCGHGDRDCRQAR